MNFSFQKRLYNLCDPFEPLPPGDTRYVDVDAFGGADHLVRGERWIDVIEGQVRLSDRPVRLLFSGLPGSGKSTELLRLSKCLAEPSGCNLLPAVVHANEFIDLSAEIDIPDLLIMMLHATELAVCGAEDDPLSAEGPLARVWSWLARLEPTLREEFPAAEPSLLAAELMSRQALRQRLRDAVARHLMAFRREVTTEFDRLLARAQRLGRSGIIVVVDSLDKLQGPADSFWDVLDSAWRVFTNGAPHLELPVHAVYTVPSALLRRERLHNVHFLPMLKVVDRDGVPSKAGVDAAFKIIEQRVPAATLRELFGETNFERRIAELIRWSGGYPRELVALLRTFVRIGAQPVSESEFQRVLRRQGDEVRRAVPDMAFNWLARVAVEKRMPVERDDHHPLSQQMLQSNVVLRYLNDVEWFDVHPAVLEIPGVLDAIRQLRERKG